MDSIAIVSTDVPGLWLIDDRPGFYIQDDRGEIRAWCTVATWYEINDGRMALKTDSGVRMFRDATEDEVDKKVGW